jgi:hypothetical protein
MGCSRKTTQLATLEQARPLGNRIKVIINNVVVNEFTDTKSRSSKGYIGLQNHHAGSKVQFRNIRVKSILPSVVALPTAAERTAA